MVVLVVVAAAGVALPATGILMALVAAALPAVLATMTAPAWVPNRVRQHLHGFHRRGRVVALDD